MSGVGYESKEIKAGSASDFPIQLNQDTRALSEVVVTGVSTAKSKKKLGFAVASISGDKLPQIPISSIDQALVGKVAGAQISSVSGNPGDQVNIVLRGINSIQGGTRPMVLLDGVEIPFADLSTLDLSQVERVEVVQGAASSAIYGAQGANGVIQIFSRKGAKGRGISINLSSSYANSSYINSGHFGKASLHPYLTDGSGNIIAAQDGGGFTAGEPISIDPKVGSVLANMGYRYGTDNGGTAPGESKTIAVTASDPETKTTKRIRGALNITITSNRYLKLPSTITYYRSAAAATKLIIISRWQITGQILRC